VTISRGETRRRRRRDETIRRRQATREGGRG